ncbi:M16 family metallopeptidase [Tautonia plasticadhaerens]|uniref:Protease 3 n=1 Tax=Tautonia plasticadhaerens TaxID=2527974 RepID=A0A518H020_9BACT|nr:pitrilysin family protein [Tautonia plasticadhaerens]QDV34181.1 Protease 3 precursor [Tautonia plasticadhaerens]
MTFHHETLPNGLRVILERNELARSVAAGFFVRAGSRDEAPELAGVSHFLEHMVFKGTARRDALSVNRDFDRIGARHNAQTSEEDTVYHASCLPEYLPQALDVLADILRPRLDDEDFETEKQVIIEEIKMYDDNPMMVAFEAAKAAHFLGHPLGGSVLGTAETVGALTVDRMRAYFADRYGPPNVVLAVAGNTEWDRVLELAGRYCGAWLGGEAPRALPPHRGIGEPKALLRKDDHQETVIAVADAPGLESDDRHAAGLVATMLGDHTGSRLYWELIDPGHADGADLSFQDYESAGAYYSFLSCDPPSAQQNLDRIADVYRAFADDGPDADELERAKNKVLSRLVLRSERPMGRLMPLGYDWTYRRAYIPVEQEVDAYSAVTRDDIRRVLADYPLLPLTVVSVGPNVDIRPPV